MEIKDLSVAVERMDEVRGGTYSFGRGGNHASNSSSNGFVASAVFVQAGHVNGSTFDVQNTVGQANVTSQSAAVADLHSRSRSTDLVSSQLSAGWGGFRI